MDMPNNANSKKKISKNNLKNNGKQVDNYMILTVIGGGSVNWMIGLMRDVYMLDSSDGGEIRLVDPLLEHAETVAKMLRHFNEVRSKNYKISVTADRKSALKNADFVICTFSPGRMDAFYNDLEIPIRYGIRQPVSMTVGPCGISAALRTCPVAFDIVEDMENVCPGAMLLNVTNPMTAVTRAFNMAAKTVKVIGLCHEFHRFSSYVGDFIGLSQPEGVGCLDYLYRYLPEQGLQYSVAGINHFIWLIKADLNERNMLPIIRDKARTRLLNPGIPGKDDIQTARKNFAKYALCDIFGCMPLAGDRHLIEFMPSLCNQRTGWGMEYGVKKTNIEERILGKKCSLRRIEEIVTGSHQVVWDRSNEEMTVIMDALLSGNKAQGIMNLPNKGQISNLPSDVIVETLADVQPSGNIVPRNAGDLPAPIAALCRLQCEIIELVVDASLKGNRDMLVKALALDPLSADASLIQIGSLADELLHANRAWLSRFYDDGDPEHVSNTDRSFTQ